MTTYEEWVSSRGFTEDTIRKRVAFFRSRVRDWPTWPADSLTLSAWLSGYDGWTRLTYQNHLNSIYRWLLEERLLDHNPMLGIKRPPMPRPKPRPLSDDDLTRALVAAPERTRAFLMLGYLAGFRAMEIAKMHGRDITEDHIHVIGKGGTDERLPTHPLLWELARSFPRDEFWFPPQTRRINPHIQAETVTYHVGRLFRSLGLAGATHRARHTYGTRLLRTGSNLRLVQDLMRHKSLETTQRYLGVDEDERHAAIRRLAA